MDNLSKLKSNARRKHKRKHKKIIREAEVFTDVYSCDIGRNRYVNGRDGFFYSFRKEIEAIGEDNLVADYSVDRVTLEYVTNNMTTGYGLHGSVVCRRRKSHHGKTYPLKAFEK